MGGWGGPCDISVSPSPFGLDFGTLDFGTSDSGLTIFGSTKSVNNIVKGAREQGRLIRQKYLVGKKNYRDNLFLDVTKTEINQKWEVEHEFKTHHEYISY